MLKILRRIPFLAQLSSRDLKEVYKISRVREYGPGESIFTKTSPADRMFIVLGGRVKIFTHAAGKKRKTFAYLQTGDFFGEMALLQGQSRSASAEAVDHSRLLVITQADFKRLLFKDPRLMYYMLKTVSERLRRADEEVESLLFRNILGRLAKTLWELGRRGRRLQGRIELAEHYTQQELADLVGTTREPLTRAISALRRAQLVENRDGRYVIVDPAKLEALCLVEP